MHRSEAIRLIKERINIVDLVRRYVDLKPNGARFTAPCPFHQETKPSFSVNPDQGFFYCFGCQASGDIFEFYSKINGLDFSETLKELAKEAGVSLDTLKKDRSSEQRQKEISEKSALVKLHELASGFFKKNLFSSSGSECREYIERRGLSKDIIERFEIGWASRNWHDLETHFRKSSQNLYQACDAGLLAKSGTGNFYDRFRGRLIFPIKNLSGQIIAFGGRIIANEEEAKYINSPDSPIYHKKDNLFGLAQARRGISAKGEAILTEGYMDVLTLHQYGFINSVGVLGTALTENQIKSLGGFTSKIILVFDGDTAGRKAALRSAAMFLARGIACSAINLPDGEDIDSFLRSNGSDSFKILQDKAPEGLKFCAGVLRTFAPRDAVEWVKDFIANVQIPELLSSYTSRLAQELGFSETDLRKELDLAKRGDPGFRRNNAIPVQQLENMRDTQIIIFATRYPDRLNDLRQIGAHTALVSERAKEFWDLIDKWGPDETFYHLDDKQKRFWMANRLPPAPPLNNGENELENLKRELDYFYSRLHASSLSAALSLQKNNFETELEYLRALQDAMENKSE